MTLTEAKVIYRQALKIADPNYKGVIDLRTNKALYDMAVLIAKIGGFDMREITE